MRKLFYSFMIGIAAFFALTGCVKPSVVSIDVNEPTQVNYYVGDTFSMSGASIDVTYSDDDVLQVAITATGVSVSSVDMSTPGEKTVTVTYKEKSDSFQITVSAIALQSIAATLNTGSNTIYTSTPLNDLKEYLSVVGTNNNGSSAGAIAQANYTLSGTLTAGTSTVTVTYNTITTTFQVTVVAVVPVSYAIKTPATDVAFDYQEAFSSAGLVVESIMNDGTHVDLLGSAYTIDSSSYNANAEGTYTINIKVSDVTVASYDVTVTVTSAQLVAERNLKIGQLTTYLEADYYPTQWGEYQTLRNNAVSAINALNSIATIQAYSVTSVNTELALVKTILEVDAETLANAKTAKIAELDMIHYNFHAANMYYEPESNQLALLLENATADINSKTLLADVTSYDLASVTAAMDAVKTMAEMDAIVLANAKTAKIAELDGYRDDYVETDYYSEEWNQLLAIYNAAVTTINENTQYSQVTSYNVVAVNSDMDAVQTKVDVDAAIAAAKVAKITQIVNYSMTDYYEEQWLDMESIYNGAVAQINALTDVGDIQSFDVAPVNADLAAVPTKLEVDAAALAFAKTGKVDELTSFYNAYVEADYYTPQWSELQGIYNSAVSDVNSKTVLADVSAYNTSAINDSMSGVKTRAKIDAEALTQAKIDKIDEFETLYMDVNYLEMNYYPAEWATIESIYQTAVNDIFALATLAEVTSFDLTTVDAAMAAVQTRSQIDGTELTSAKNAKLVELDTAYANYNFENYYPNEQALLQAIYENAWSTFLGYPTVAEVNAFSISEVNNLWAAVPNQAAIDQQAFDILKMEMLNTMSTAYGSYNSTNYYTQHWQIIESVSSTTVEAINAQTTIAGLQAIDVQAALNAMDQVLTKTEYDTLLNQAKFQKIAALDTYLASMNYTNYYSDQWNELVGIVNDANTAINAATTLEAVGAINIAEITAQMDAVLTMAEFDAYAMENERLQRQVALDTYYGYYVQADYRPEQWSELVAIYQDATTTLQGLTQYWDVYNFDPTYYDESMNAIKTEAEMIAHEALADERLAKLAELILPESSLYYYSEWQTILEIQQYLFDDLELLEDAATIAAFDVTDYQSWIGNILTANDSALNEFSYLESVDGLNRPLTQVEKDALVIAFGLKSEYDYKAELLYSSVKMLSPIVEFDDFMIVSIENLELVLGYTLDATQLNAISVYRGVYSELTLIMYRNQLLWEFDQILDEASINECEPQFRAQDWQIIYAAYQSSLAEVDALYNDYIGTTMFPVNLEMQFYRIFLDFIAEVEQYRFESELIEGELEQALLLNPLTFEPITDGTLYLTYEYYTLYIEGLLAQTQLAVEEPFNHWLALGFVLPENFDVAYDLEGNISNISVFTYQTDSEWHYMEAPRAHIEIVNGVPYYVYLLNMQDTMNYLSTQNPGDGTFDIRIVFGENLADPLLSSYIEGELPGRAQFTTPITIDVYWLEPAFEETAFVDTLSEWDAALANVDVSIIFVHGGIIQLDSDTVLDGKLVIIGPKATLVNNTFWTLSVVNFGQISNMGRMYNYGTFTIGINGNLDNSGFAFNLGNMSIHPDGNMSGSGTGFNYLNYQAVDTELMMRIAGESYVASPETLALIEEVARLRTNNFGYLPSFLMDWQNTPLATKEAYISDNFIATLTQNDLDTLVAYFDFFYQLRVAATQANPSRNVEMNAYNIAWKLGTLSDNSQAFIDELILAIMLKHEFEVNGGHGFEVADMSYIEWIIGQGQPEFSFTPDQWVAVENYRNYYRHLIRQEFIAKAMKQYGFATTIGIDDYNNLYDVAYEIVHILNINDNQLPFDAVEAGYMIDTYFSDIQIAGYEYYSAFYHDDHFIGYAVEYATGLGRALSEEELTALRIYYDLVHFYEDIRYLDEPSFEELSYWQVYDSFYDYFMLSQQQSDSWYLIEALNIQIELLQFYPEGLDPQLVSAIPTILQLMSEYEYFVYYAYGGYPETLEDATLQQILEVLARPLTLEETAALDLFMSLYQEIMDL